MYKLRQIKNLKLTFATTPFIKIFSPTYLRYTHT